jgi:Adenine deaminase
VRRAIALGLDPVLAFRLASLSAARHYGFRDRGAIAPGYRADLITFESLDDVRPDLVVLGGRRVAQGGKLLVDVPSRGISEGPSFRVDGFDASRLRLAAAPGAHVRVIEVRPGSLATGSGSAAALVVDGAAAADPSRDLAKLAVVERHRGTGNVGVSFARGFGLARGAIASSVAHDSHNVVVCGCDDASMETAVRRAAEIGGGIVVAHGAQVLAEVPLPVAGLMSNASLEEVDAAEESERGHARLGTAVDHPFMTLAFLALPVIPELKLTDRGSSTWRSSVTCRRSREARGRPRVRGRSGRRPTPTRGHPTRARREIVYFCEIHDFTPGTGDDPVDRFETGRAGGAPRGAFA